MDLVVLLGQPNCRKFGAFCDGNGVEQGVDLASLVEAIAGVGMQYDPDAHGAILRGCIYAGESCGLSNRSVASALRVVLNNSWKKR